MKGGIRLAALAFVVFNLLPASHASAQEADSYRKFSLDISGGLLRPQGEMRRWQYAEFGGERRSLFQQTGLFGTHFGYRPIRYAQIDAGLELGVSAVGRRTISLVSFETGEYDDFIFFLPLGGRAVIPLASERLLLSIGGGGVYVNNIEISDSGVTDAERSGWGAYGLGQVLFVFGESRRIGVGFTSRWTRVHLSRGFLPGYGSARIADQWLFLGATLSIRF